jgi:hypothetical protein
MIKHIAPLLLIAGLGLHAETDQQRGKRVVDESLAALGGDKFLGMTDRVENGRAYSFYRERLTGLAIAKIYTRYRAVPNAKLQVEERETFGKKEESIVLFMPSGEAYELTYRGARPLPEDRTVRYVDTTTHNVLYILHNRLREPGMTFESKGADVIDNVPVEIVDIIDSQNRVTTVYFHRSTKLPMRQVFSRRDPQTRLRDEEVTLFSKYRDVGEGVQWPFAIQRERNGEKLFELYSDSVTINQALPDKLFLLPADAKKLKSVN